MFFPNPTNRSMKANSEASNPEVQLIPPPVIKVRAPMIFGGSGGEIYTVFDEESESAVRIDEFLHPEEKIKKNQN